MCWSTSMRHREKDRTLFPAGDRVCRAARDRCARSCAAYNQNAEFASVEERSVLYTAIINSSIADGTSLQDLAGLDGKISNGLRDASASSTRGGCSEEPPSPPISSSHQAHHQHHQPPLPDHLDHASPEGGSAAAAACASLTSQSRHYSSNCNPFHAAIDTVSAESTSSKNNHAAPCSIPKQTLAEQEQLQAPPQARVQSHLAKSGDERFPGQAMAPFIKPPFHVDYGARLHIGKSTFINRNCKILDTPVREIRIGERCLIGPDCHLYAVEHPVEYELRCSPAGVPSYGLEISIGDDVWIGGHVTILGGVSLGEGCVIGANSLVTKDVPAFHLAYGSPARVIRRLKGSDDRSMFSAWAMNLSEAMDNFLMRCRRTVRHPLNMVRHRSSLALGASLCTAAAAFLYLQFVTNG